MQKLTKEHESGVILGEEYTDSTLGISGIAASVQVYLTGCDRVCLERLDSDGDNVIQHWADVPVLVDSEGNALTEEADVNLRVANDPGGPGKPSASRERKDPGRGRRQSSIPIDCGHDGRPGTPWRDTAV